jgi:2-oxoglutarate ferredoxin oxidoreductase subunit delta
MAKPKLKEHHINRDWCKGCGICVEFCPKKVLELDKQNKVVAVHLTIVFAANFASFVVRTWQ